MAPAPAWSKSKSPDKATTPVIEIGFKKKKWRGVQARLGGKTETYFASPRFI